MPTPAPPRFARRRDRLRKAAGGIAIDNAFRGLSRFGRLFPHARPERHGVEITRDIPYLGTGRRAHRLDIYRPADAPPEKPLPVVLYIHGGGFRILSKDTHWVMGLAFARRGFVVVNINYRLAPAFPFPAALEDVAAAFAWTLDNAAAYGGNPTRLIAAGESAGANLVTALTVSACYERPEPWARAIWERDVVPRVTVPFCGMLQVSDPERYSARPDVTRFIGDRVEEVAHAYLDQSDLEPHDWRALADPLCVLEEGRAPQRPLPPFFASVGTRDILLDDTRRLKRALDALRVPCQAPEYDGELHAFQAFVWRKNARQSWRDLFAFLGGHLEGVRPATDAAA